MMRRNTYPWPIVVLVLLAMIVPGAAQDATKSLGDLTGNWWLALDARVWESRGAAQLQFHAFEKYSGNPVLRGDKPWEGRMPYVYGSVLPQEDGKGLRMWYHGYVDDKSLLEGNHRYTNLYATSTDGFHWSKPELGLHTFQGSKANNIVLMREKDPGASHAPNVIHTPWEKDPNRRYKMITYVYYDGYYGATSPDGMHWTDLPHKQLFNDHGDVGNFVWDARRSAYIGYPKIFDQIRGFRRRCVGFTETQNFDHWPASRLILAPDEEDDRGYLTPEGHTDFYGLSAFPYQTMYLGLLWIYRIEKGDERVWPELVYSADGLQWQRVPAPRTPVLALGADGAWDDGMIYTTNHPIVRHNRIHLYYGGFDGPHNSKVREAGVGLATMRRDGFASLSTPEDTETEDTETSVTTVAFHAASGNLLVNAEARDGELRAELLDAEGKPLPGYGKQDAEPIGGDGVEQVLRWKGRESLPDTPFRIRFWLKNAALYSFFVGDAASHNNSNAPMVWQ